MKLFFGDAEEQPLGSVAVVETIVIEEVAEASPKAKGRYPKTLSGGKSTRGRSKATETDENGYGAKVRKARVKAKMSQATLAKVCHCTQSHISLVERGLRSVNSKQKMAIKRAVGV